MFEHDTVLDTRGGAVRKAEGSGEVQRGGTIGDNMGGVRRVYNGEELGGGRFKEIGRICTEVGKKRTIDGKQTCIAKCFFIYLFVGQRYVEIGWRMDGVQESWENGEVHQEER